MTKTSTMRFKRRMIQISGLSLGLLYASLVNAHELAGLSLLMSVAQREAIERERTRWLQGIVDAPLPPLAQPLIPAMPTFIRLSAIIQRAGDAPAFALLNDQAYEIGEYKEGLRLIAIEGQYATVEFRQQRRQIRVGEVYSSTHWPASLPVNIEVK